MKVTLQDVTYSYAVTGKAVLRGVTISIPSGESLAILGPSGAGKSTLLRVVAGFLGARHRGILTGSVRLDGRAPIDLDVTTRDRIGFAFQEPFLLPFLTVQENLTLGKALGRQSTVPRSASDVLSRIGLLHDTAKWPHQLSGGMRTRLALARELMSDPSVLLLDEPFGALDAVWRSSLYELVAEHRRSSPATLLLVTHDIPEAVLLCQRAIVLSSDGCVAGEVHIGVGKPDLEDPDAIEDFLSSKAREQATLIRLLEREHPAHAARQLNG